MSIRVISSPIGFDWDVRLQSGARGFAILRVPGTDALMLTAEERSVAVQQNLQTTALVRRKCVNDAASGVLFALKNPCCMRSCACSCGSWTSTGILARSIDNTARQFLFNS
eukprot:1466084-Amphidinium_carterae.1